MENHVQGVKVTTCVIQFFEKHDKKNKFDKNQPVAETGKCPSRLLQLPLGERWRKNITAD